MRIEGRQNERLTRLALETVSEAAAEAQEQIVEVTWGIRLALRWLMISGVIKDWHARRFVEAIGRPIRELHNPHARRP